MANGFRELTAAEFRAEFLPRGRMTGEADVSGRGLTYMGRPVTRVTVERNAMIRLHSGVDCISASQDGSAFDLPAPAPAPVEIPAPAPAPARLSLASVRRDLAPLGVKIERTPYDEYRVAFAKSDRESSAYFTADLQDALDTGRAMAAEGDKSTGPDDTRSETLSAAEELDAEAADAAEVTSAPASITEARAVIARGRAAGLAEPESTCGACYRGLAACECPPRQCMPVAAPAESCRLIVWARKGGEAESVHDMAESYSRAAMESFAAERGYVPGQTVPDYGAAVLITRIEYESRPVDAAAYVQMAERRNLILAMEAAARLIARHPARIEPQGERFAAISAGPGSMYLGEHATAADAQAAIEADAEFRAGLRRDLDAAGLPRNPEPDAFGLRVASNRGEAAGRADAMAEFRGAMKAAADHGEADSLPHYLAFVRAYLDAVSAW